MAKIYADLILKGLKTIDDVPLKLRDEVTAILGIVDDAAEPNAEDGETV